MTKGKDAKYDFSCEIAVQFYIYSHLLNSAT